MEKTIYSPKQQRFLELMVQARKDAKLTQQQLADKLGKPQSFVAKYEGGERRLDVVEFVTICEKLNVKPELIVKVLV